MAGKYISLVVHFVWSTLERHEIEHDERYIWD